MSNQKEKTVDIIFALADKFGVVYIPTGADEWTNHITQLSDDDVRLDHVELLLVELQRAGHLTRPEALRLQVNYLREAKL
jgi:hypothetical protein